MPKCIDGSGKLLLLLRKREAEIVPRPSECRVNGNGLLQLDDYLVGLTGLAAKQSQHKGMPGVLGIDFAGFAQFGHGFVCFASAMQHYRMDLVRFA